MRGIMFNTKLGLEQAVLEGRKTVTRRICKYQPTDLNSKWHWVTGGDGGFLRRGVHPTSPRYRPPYDIGEIVAIKQCYNDILKPELYHELLQHYDTQFIEDVAGYNLTPFVGNCYQMYKAFRHHLYKESGSNSWCTDADPNILPSGTEPRPEIVTINTEDL